MKLLGLINRNNVTLYLTLEKTMVQSYTKVKKKKKSMSNGLNFLSKSIN